MAKEILVGGALTEAMIAAGKALVVALDKSNLLVRGAFWFLMSEQRLWRLVIVSPEVSTNGPKAAYRKIRAATNRIVIASGSEIVGPGDVSVIDVNDGLYQNLRLAVQTGPGVSGVRFSRNTINHMFIEDAYIYRLV